MEIALSARAGTRAPGPAFRVARSAFQRLTFAFANSKLAAHSTVRARENVPVVLAIQLAKFLHFADPNGP